MMAERLPIAYESRHPVVLEPGEVVCWQGQHPPDGPPHKITRYCLTDRRAVLIAPGDPPQVSAAALLEMRVLIVEHRRHGSVSIVSDDLIRFDHLPDPQLPARHILEMIIRSGRARQRRRSGLDRPRRQIPMHQTHPDPPPLAEQSLPPMVQLLPGERLLWSGRPRRWMPVRWPEIKRLLVVLLWTLIPAGIVIRWWLPQGQSIPLVFVVFGLIWLMVVGWMLMVNLIQRIRGRPPTWYALTTYRAITVQRLGRRTQVSSLMLDLQASISFTVEADNRGEVGFGFAHSFADISDPAAVHDLALQAIHAAGGVVVAEPDT